MKKLITTALVTGLLLGLGATAAQGASVNHELEIVIPAVLMIRFVDGGGNPVTEPEAVVFAPEAADIAAGEVDFVPVDVDLNWADIQVFANTTTSNWQVSVATIDAEFDWSKVTVSPATGGAVAVDEFPLPVNAGDTIFESTTLLNGLGAVWTSLGISPASYSLTLDGFEEEGSYETTVIYTIGDL